MWLPDERLPNETSTEKKGRLTGSDERSDDGRNVAGQITLAPCEVYYCYKNDSDFPKDNTNTQVMCVFKFFNN